MHNAWIHSLPTDTASFMSSKSFAPAVKAEHPQGELSFHSCLINLTSGEGVQHWVEKWKLNLQSDKDTRTH